MTSMFMKRFDSALYQDGRLLSRFLMIDPPRSKFSVTAFRELNPKSQRELDASVLWKGVQSLSSALESLSISSTKTMFGYIFAGSVEYAKDYHDTFEDMISWCEIMATTVNIYHPIIIMHCPMWLWNGKELSEVSHVRLLRRRHGARSDWCDVFQIGAVPEYLAQLTAHYDQFVPKGLEQLRPHLKLNRRATKR